MKKPGKKTMETNASPPAPNPPVVPTSSSSPPPIMNAPKKPRTPAQLEQLRIARERRKENISRRKSDSQPSSRDSSAHEFVKRLEEAEPTTRVESRPRKRKRDSERSVRFSSSGEFAIGALVMAGLGFYIFQNKKKTLLQNSPSPPGNTPPSSQGNPSLLNTSSLFM
jgi:hypothetical protein